MARTRQGLLALVIVHGSSLNWGPVRSFEVGIFQFTIALLDGSRNDGAIDIRVDRPDAHGN